MDFFKKPIFRNKPSQIDKSKLKFNSVTSLHIFLNLKTLSAIFKNH